MSCTFLPGVLLGAGVSIPLFDTIGNILAHFVFCCLSAFFLSFPLTLLCLPTVWLSVCSSPSSFRASIFLVPSHCVLFSSRLPSTPNVCFQKGMHRSEPGVPQFPALFLSTSYVTKAGWFATLFFPVLFALPTCIISCMVLLLCRRLKDCQVTQKT